MKKDYRNYSTASKSNTPFFYGVLLGILLGVGASLAVVLYIQNHNPFATPSQSAPSITTAPATPPDVAPKDVSKDITKSKPEASHYDFYDSLKNDKSKGSPDALPATALPDNTETVTEKPSMYLQIGAYTNATEADNVRAKLALQGFEAQVQTTNLDERVWYRVRIGPWSDVTKANALKDDLVRRGYIPTLIKE